MRRKSFSSHSVNLGVTLAIVFSFVLAPGVVSAQTHYTFTKIADTVSDPQANLGGVSCVGLSNTGTVVIHSNQIWRGNGTAGLTGVAQISPICPSINDLDEITHFLQPSPGIVTLVRNSNGILTTLASSAVAPYLYTPNTYLPSLSNTGSAVFVSGVPSQGIPVGIAVGPAGPIVYNPSIDPSLTPLFSPASMNDSLTVAFLAGRAAAGGKLGIYRGSTVPLIEAGDAVSGGTLTGFSLVRPVINNSGTVAFVGAVNATGAHVYTTADGVSVTLVGTNPVDRIAINDSGAVVFRKTLSGGAGSGLYLGRPGSIDQTVIAQGDAIDGSTLSDGFIWEEALNGGGQIAFWAQLADGRRGVYRADPNRPPVASDGTASVTAGASTTGTLNATDPDGDSLTYTIVSNGTKGTAGITNAATGAYTYTANVGSSGTDTFTFKANDGFVDSNVATITVTITPPEGICAANISATVAISSQGSLKLNRKTGRYTQSLTLKNGDGAVSGPVSLVLDSLSANATLLNASGTTACAAPSGSPYINVTVGTDAVFSPRERSTVTLEFTNPSGQPVTYTTRVLAGAGNR